MLLSFIVLLPEGIYGQSVNDGFAPIINGTVFATAVQSDGKILIGGSFTSVEGEIKQRYARLHVDGTVDASFPTDANGDVYSIAIQQDGKIIIAGNFTLVLAVPRQRIARVNSNGTFDAAFNVTINSAVRTVALQEDGKILIGGEFTTVAGQTRNGIARLNSDGSLDMTFDPNVNGTVYSVAVQADQKILVGGTFTTIGGETRNHVARINSDGTLDVTFDPNVDNDVLAVIEQNDGRIYIGGTFSTVSGVSRSGFARLDPAGALDASFTITTNGRVATIVQQPDGKIVFGGGFTVAGGASRTMIARLNQNGTLDASLNLGINSDVETITIQPDGKVLFGGQFVVVAGQSRTHLARVHSDGVLDFSLSITSNSGISGMAVQPDGKIIICGPFSSISEVPRSRIARLHPSGAVDASFNTGIIDLAVNTVTLQPDGKIVIGGDFTGRIARLNSSGGLDGTFNPDAVNNTVLALAIQADGKILMGGTFTAVGAEIRAKIARLNADGSLDTGFNPGSDGDITSIVLQDDGKILIGGFFSTVGGVGRTRIARLNSDGTVDMTFNPSADERVLSIAVQSDGKIILGGGFSTVGGMPRAGIARVLADGTLDASFNPGADSFVFSVIAQEGGKILVGGGFGTIAGQTRPGVARLNSDGSIDATFGNLAPNSAIDGIALAQDGKILVEGGFSSIGGVPRTWLARISSEGAAAQDLSVTEDGTVTWLLGQSMPVVHSVTFEHSTDLITWVDVGSVSKISGGWQITGLMIPKGQTGYIRARGVADASRVIVESIKEYHFQISTTFLSGDSQSQIVTTQLANPFRVVVTDTDGNPAQGVSVTFTVVSFPIGASGQSMDAGVALTDVNGIAAATFTLGKKIGVYTVNAKVATSPAAAIPFTSTGLLGPSVAIVLTSGNSQSKLYTSTLDNPFVATVTDVGGNPVPGEQVDFAIATVPAGATGQSISIADTTTNTSGEAATLLTLGDKPGNYIVTASSTGLSGSPLAFTATAVVGPPVAIILTSGNNQSKQFNTALDNPLIVTVTDAVGFPVFGTNVTFGILSTPAGATGQSLSTTNVTTDSSGEASTILTLGTRSGNYTVTATSGVLTGSPVSFTAIALLGPPTTIVLSSGNSQSKLYNSVLDDPFVVRVTDGGGNSITGVNVTFAITGSPTGGTGQSLSVSDTATNTNGEASTVFTLGNKPGDYTVTATSGTLTGSPIEFTATALVGPAAEIALTSGNNQSKLYDLVLDDPFVVTVTDAGGNPISGTNITFAIASTPAGATGQGLSVTDVATDANGEASTVLTLGDKSGTYTVTATSGSLTGSPVEFTTTALAGPPALFAMVSGNNQIGPGKDALDDPMVVLVTDVGGNPIPGVNVDFAIIAFPVGATGQSLSAANTTTNASGEASTVLTFGTLLGTYTVSATSVGLGGSPLTFTATAEVGAPASITLVSGNPQDPQVIGTTLPIPYVVQVTDAGGYPVPATGVSFEITETPSGATGQQLTVENPLTDVDGKASTTLILGNKVGSYTVEATFAGQLGSPVKFTASAKHGLPAQLVPAFGNQQTGVVGEMLPQQMTVKVIDAGENPVPGVWVTFQRASAPTGAEGHALKDSLVQSDGNGFASTRFMLGSMAGNYSVLASAYGVSGIFLFAKATGVTSVEDLGVVPTEFQLFQNYPNPFNPSTTVRFGVPELSSVTVEIYDLLGNRVGALVEGEYNAGTYQAQWNASNVSSGMYLVRIQARALHSDKSFTSYKKITLLK